MEMKITPEFKMDPKNVLKNYITYLVHATHHDATLDA